MTYQWTYNVINFMGKILHAALLENVTDDANAKVYMTKFSTISLYLTNCLVTKSFALASSSHTASYVNTFLPVWKPRKS